MLMNERTDTQFMKTRKKCRQTEQEEMEEIEKHSFCVTFLFCSLEKFYFHRKSISISIYIVLHDGQNAPQTCSNLVNLFLH